MKKLLFVLFLLVSNVISAQDTASVEIDTTFKRTETDLDKIQSKFKSFYDNGFVIVRDKVTFNPEFIKGNPFVTTDGFYTGMPRNVDVYKFTLKIKL